MKKERKWKGILPLALSSCLLMSVVSCGSESDDSSDDPQQEEETQTGVFRVVLNPENTSVSTAAGTGTVTIFGDQFETRIVLGGARSTTHAQHIHAGSRCPTAADDTNGDGVVDAAEASAVYGPVILDLDDELDTTGGTFPSGSSYDYSESDSLSQILSNLGLDALNVEGKVINIHGVPESTDLPSTISGSKADFPIACGVIQQLGSGEAGTTDSAASAASAASAVTDATSAASATTGN